MINSRRPPIYVDQESADLIAQGNDDFYRTLNPDLYPYNNTTKAKKKRISSRRADPVHYQRFLLEASSVIDTRFDQQTQLKDALMKRHFPRQYHSQKINDYDATKKGATFSHLVHAAREIIARQKK